MFDVGNVLVRWDPHHITSQIFPDHPQENITDLAQQIFKSQIWHDLNLGKIDEHQLVQQYQQNLPHIDPARFHILLPTVKESLIPVAGSFEIMQKLHQANFPLYALTDNTHGIVEFLKEQHPFWPLFRGAVVSAEIGHLKPSQAIYRHLLTTYQLNPEETLFFDDLEMNIEGAKAMGMHAIQFETAEKCLADLRRLGIIA